MRVVMILAVALASLLIGWLLAMYPLRVLPMSGIASPQTGPTIEQIQALAQLVTERVNVSDVIETQLSGYTGSIRAVVVVKGSVLISTDLSRARFESVDESARHIVLVLPQPTVLEATVDHEQTRVFAVTETGLWRITPGDNTTSAAVVDLAYREAQQVIRDAANDGSLLVRARQHGEQVLAEFVRGGGWEMVVKWQN